MHNNREFDVSGICSPVQLSVGGGQLITLEDPSLNIFGYQLLPLATSKLVDDNREFYFSAIFSFVEHLLVEGSL